ncbi:MAG: pantoate--beta-alanine ligase [Marinilabiliales bacterium]|nr:MAG: pantoate--beta-alanine ligase [Marinilabiliales bacterium]
MEIIKTVEDLVARREELEGVYQTIGFVPTMGALHKGHISLVEKSVKESDYTIVSVFVNPKQFNEQSDFDNYPVNYSSDLKLLEYSGCDMVFMPKSDDIYSDYDGFEIDFGGLDKVYEGEFRPGHFQGVVDVVYRLFDLVKPQKSYFGQKDFQQLAIIKRLVSEANLKIEIVSCPIVREDSGLAMSSRNERLSNENRLVASEIYREMQVVATEMKIGDSTSLFAERFNSRMEKIDVMKPEYCIFCHPDSLQKIKKVEKNTVLVMCVAVLCTNVRLIDNIILVF